MIHEKTGKLTSKNTIKIMKREATDSGKKYVQITYLINELYPAYIKNSQNSVFLKKLSTELPYDPAIPLLHIQPKELKTYPHKIFTWMFIAALFIIASREFPGGPVVKTPPSNAGGLGSIPGWGTKIPHAIRCSKTNKQTNT